MSMEATIKELSEAAKRMAAATQPTAKEFAKLGKVIDNMSNNPQKQKSMKVKEYFKSLARVVLVSPFIFVGIIVLATAILLKSLGYCLLGDIKAATSEIKAL